VLAIISAGLVASHRLQDGRGAGDRGRRSRTTRRGAHRVPRSLASEVRTFAWASVLWP